jgi:glycosyltransferase involved in cell wall biosynthesis
MPVRNGGLYLAEAVRSVLSQTFADFEFLLIDDGSTDDAIANLPEELRGDPRLRVLDNPQRGLVPALNFGIAQARAALVARMDADDVSLPQRFRAQVDFLDCNPCVAVVGAQVAYIDAEGRGFGHVSSFCTESEAIAEALLVRGCVLKHPTIMARREAIEAAGGYRALMAGAEDYDLWLRMSERARIANLPDVLLQYREHTGQYSHGINLTQRFARDLAIYAARERRIGRPDPFGVGADLAAANWSVEDDELAYPEPLRRLRSAYRALAYFERRRQTIPSEAEIADVLWGAEASYLGDGRRYRTVAAVRCAHLAGQRGDGRLALRASRAALRLGAFRAILMLSGLRPAT